jgi:hypothetical protein
MDNVYEADAYQSVRRDLEEMIRSRPDDVSEPLSEPVGMA